MNNDHFFFETHVQLALVVIPSPDSNAAQTILDRVLAHSRIQHVPAAVHHDSRPDSFAYTWTRSTLRQKHGFLIPGEDFILSTCTTISLLTKGEIPGFQDAKAITARAEMNGKRLDSAAAIIVYLEGLRTRRQPFDNVQSRTNVLPTNLNVPDNHQGVTLLLPANENCTPPPSPSKADDQPRARTPSTPGRDCSAETRAPIPPIVLRWLPPKPPVTPLDEAYNDEFADMLSSGLHWNCQKCSARYDDFLWSKELHEEDLADIHGQLETLLLAGASADRCTESSLIAFERSVGKLNRVGERADALAEEVARLRLQIAETDGLL